MRKGDYTFLLQIYNFTFSSLRLPSFQQKMCLLLSWNKYVQPLLQADVINFKVLQGRKVGNHMLMG